MSATLAAFSAFLSIFSSFLSPVANKKTSFAQQARRPLLHPARLRWDIKPVGPAPAVFGYSVVECEYIRRRCAMRAARREPARAPRARPRPLPTSTSGGGWLSRRPRATGRGPHRRREVDGAQVLALGGARLGTHHRIH